MNKIEALPIIRQEDLERLSQKTGVSPVSVKRIIGHLNANPFRNGFHSITESYKSYRAMVERSALSMRANRESLEASMSLDLVPPIFPSHVQIQTVGGCNASCVMCSMADPRIRKYQKGRISDEVFSKLVNECAQYDSCEEIALYLQNEPLLDATLAHKIDTVKKLSKGRIAARIVTNGYLLNRAKAKELISAGLDAIAISLNAHTAPTYSILTGGLDFNITLQNIEELLEVSPQRLLITLTFMITIHNQAEVQDAVKYWTKRGVLCGAYGINTMGGTLSSYEKLAVHSQPKLIRECYLPLESAAILCTGDVILCCADWARKSVCGNITRQSLKEVWHSKPLSELRSNAIKQIFSHEVCSRCLGQTRLPSNLIY